MEPPLVDRQVDRIDSHEAPERAREVARFEQRIAVALGPDPLLFCLAG
jgi:hypothetical protein